MTKEDLKTKSKEEVLKFIRQRLAFESSILKSLRNIDKEEFNKEHKRFEMSGYESTIGECTKSNLNILNKFADLGIYDYTSYLFLDFYKGCGTLYFQYFNETENIELDLCGYGTTEIIYRVFEKTIFSNKKTRRRN